jgi:hypothetical protein
MLSSNFYFNGDILTNPINVAYALGAGAKVPVGIRTPLEQESKSSHLKGFFYICRLWQIVDEHLWVAVSLVSVVRTRFRSATLIRTKNGRPLFNKRKHHV